MIRPEYPLPVQGLARRSRCKRRQFWDPLGEEQINSLCYLHSERFSRIFKAYVAFDIAIVSSSRKQTTAGAGRISKFRPVEPGKVAAKSRTQHNGRGPPEASGVLTVSFFALTACQNPA